jgi:hypothetical protein
MDFLQILFKKKMNNYNNNLNNSYYKNVDMIALT